MLSSSGGGGDQQSSKSANFLQPTHKHRTQKEIRPSQMGEKMLLSRLVTNSKNSSAVSSSVILPLAIYAPECPAFSAVLVQHTGMGWPWVWGHILVKVQNLARPEGTPAANSWDKCIEVKWIQWFQFLGMKLWTSGLVQAIAVHHYKDYVFPSPPSRHVR